MKKLLSLLVGVMLICSFGACLAEGENAIITPMPDDLILMPRIDITKGDITITEGWNLIAMPVLPVEPYTVEQFQKAVTASGWNKVYKDISERGEDINIMPLRPSDWQVPVVAVYKNGQFERYPKEGVTYNMVLGEAYFVYARYSGKRAMIQYSILEGTEMPPIEQWHPKTTVTIIGKPLNVPVSLNLNRGWNGVSTMGRELVKEELAEQGIKATRVAFWSAEMQEWKQVLPDDRLTMAPDVGFFLLCEENGLYIPGLNTSIEPPVPPLPKPIVSYTGRVSIIYDVPCPYRLECADGTNIPLKGKDAQIDQAIAKAANEYGTEFIVTGSFAVVDLKNPWTGEPVKMKVLVVSEIIPASKRVSYTGIVNSLSFIPEAVPPYNLSITTNTGVQIPLKGANDKIESWLEDYANKKVKCTVWGVIKIMTYSDGMIVGSPLKEVKVLVVDSVGPAYLAEN